MFITYQKLESELGLYRFIRLNYNTGEFDIKMLKFNDAVRYIVEWRPLGYIFIPYAEF